MRDTKPGPWDATHPRPLGVDPSAAARPIHLALSGETFEFEFDGAIIGRLFESGDYPCLESEQEQDDVDDEHRLIGAKIVERFNALAGLRPEEIPALVKAAPPFVDPENVTSGNDDDEAPDAEPIYLFVTLGELRALRSAVRRVKGKE